MAVILESNARDPTKKMGFGVLLYSFITHGNETSEVRSISGAVYVAVLVLGIIIYSGHPEVNMLLSAFISISHNRTTPLVNKAAIDCPANTVLINWFMLYIIHSLLYLEGEKGVIVAAECAATC